MRRVPLQITMSPHGDGEPDIVIACNDGTMWMLGHGGQWVELPGVPQDESNDPLAKLYARNVDLQESLRTAESKLHRLGDLACTLTANNGKGQWSEAHRKIGEALAEMLGIEI
jgi:hypothetical protein